MENFFENKLNETIIILKRLKCTYTSISTQVNVLGQ